MPRLLSELAGLLGLELRGEDRAVEGVNTLEAAGPAEVSFLANPRYTHLLATTRAGAVIVAPAHADSIPCALVSANPYFDFGRILALFATPQGSLSGVSDLAFVHPEAELDTGCTVYPFAFIGPRTRIGAGSVLFPGCYVGEDCRIGSGCLLYPNVTLMAGTKIGNGCILHAGVVLGADGFGFARTDSGIQKIPQVGVVRLGDNVEVGAGTTIDRSALGETRVGDGTKIDNLVQIAHSVEMGRNCLIVAQAGISGSTKVGDNVTMAGQVGVAGHLSIGSGVTLGPRSGVARSIPDGETMGGVPAVDKATYMRTLTVMPKLPDMYKRIGKLEKELEELKKLAAKE